MCFCEIRNQGSCSGYYLKWTYLKLVLSHRDLGVIIGHTLRFNKNLRPVVIKTVGTANQLLRSTVMCMSKSMVVLVVSHLRPLLNYCSSVWGMGYVDELWFIESV